MHSAPAVSVSGSGGRPWRWLGGGLAVAAAGSLAAWSLALAGLHPAWALPAMAGAAWMAARRRPAPTHALGWDGQVWSMDGSRVRAAVMVDLGRWMLLRLRPEATPRRAVWMPLTAAEAGASWHALRVALYARPPRDAGPPASAAAGCDR